MIKQPIKVSWNFILIIRLTNFFFYLFLHNIHRGVNSNEIFRCYKNLSLLYVMEQIWTKHFRNWVLQDFSEEFEKCIQN